MDLIKRKFNHSVKHPVIEQPYVALDESTGTFEMAQALDGLINVTLYREYEPEQLFEFFATGGRAGIYLNPNEWDLKRFTQVYSKLPAGNITHVYVHDDYADNATFVKFIRMLRKGFPGVHIYAGYVTTEEGIAELAQITEGIVADDLALMKAANYHGAKLIYPTAQLGMLAAGFDKVNISSKLCCTEEAAGSVTTVHDRLVKTFQGNQYNTTDETPAQIYRDVHAQLEEAVYRAGFTKYEDFIKYAELN